MVNDLFREIVSIFRKFMDPIVAQVIVKKNCEKCGITPDTVDLQHLPSIMLHLATDEQLLSQLRSHEFSTLMKKIMIISNRSTETVDAESIRQIVATYRNEDNDQPTLTKGEP